MEDDSSRTQDSVDPIEALEQDDRRRRFVKALVGTMMGGVLGFGTYPWVAGDRRGELVRGVKSVVKQLQAQPRRPREDMVSARTIPVRLDAEGCEYEVFLANLNLRHIRPMDILRPHFKIRGTVTNGLPPRECWASIAPALRVADELRERLGARLLAIVSAYRSPAYNATCPGAATHSYHLRNMALDLVFDHKPEEVVKAAETLRTEGFFAGGIGRYPGFTHVDTRGRAVDW